jgi:hypothetical protein
MVQYTSGGSSLNLPGATAATRYAGGTVSGAPVSGTFAVGDFIVDETGLIWICTVAGTPGTWANAGASAGVSTFNTRTGAVVPGNADYLAVASGGLTGAVAATRFAGGTASGAPASGTFAVGDFVIDQTGDIWICTVAGSPGTWVDPVAEAVQSVAAADTSIVVAGTATAPTVRTGTLDVIAAQHPPAADWSNNSHKITSVSNGSGAQDAVAFGQLAAYAPLASPALTGTPTAPTAAPGTNSTQLASTAYADAIAALKLSLTGGTMSGAIAMGANKITGLANGGAAADAAAFGQILALQATTGAAGYTLVNGTGNIITWTAPNDGNMHRVVLMAILLVTTTEVGGSLNVAYTLPNGTAENSQVIVGAQTPGAKLISTAVFLIEANTAFTFQQASALTSGAAVAWAEIWAS